MNLISFVDNQKRMIFAEDFLIKDRLNSLEYDVNRCLADDQNNSSPLPALMYCFSMIDLLGALYSGNAKGGNTTANSKKYMIDFMSYDHDKIDLLQTVYRHKTVHLSAPQTAIKYKGQIISWRLHNTSKSDHLNIDYSESGNIDLFGCGTIVYMGKFMVDITNLKDDIKESVTKVSVRYLAELRKKSNLQNNFTKAVNDIYEPLAIS